jgi:toxin ParE1/3/4
MTGVTFSPSARRDLLGIFEFIAADRPEAALGFIERVESACGRLGAFPEMGSLREDLAPALRAFAMGRYVILYRPAENGVDIVRVVHGARDLPSLLD